MKRIALLALAIGLLAPATRGDAQPPGAPPGGPPAAPQQDVGAGRAFTGGSVETLDDLRSLIIRAPREQLEAMLDVIEQMDLLSQVGQPDLEVVPLQHADSESLSSTLTRIYDARLAAVSQANQSNVSRVAFVPLAQPNAIVVIVKRQDMEEVVEFVKKMDSETADADDQFKVFPLQRASALAIQQKLEQFFEQREDAAGLRVRVESLGDERTNSVVVHGSPVDLRQAERLIKQLDSTDNAVLNELRIFPLTNAIATELSFLLQQAISTQGMLGVGAGMGAIGAPGQQIGQQPFQQQQVGQPGQVGQAGMGQSQKTARLRFLQLDDEGKTIESGIIEDIFALPDDRTNSLIVTAPPTSMDMVAALITQLDKIPNPAVDLKVFSLQNSDAQMMLTTLQTIFLQTGVGQQGLPGAGVGGIGGIGGAGAMAAQPRTFALGEEPGELSRAPLSFAVDVRTNSIIVSGTPQDLLAVEAVIMKLETSTAMERRTIVYPLRNLTALDASAAMEDFLAAQDALAVGQEGRITFQDQIAREVTITPEPITNRLIVSSSPRYFDEVLRILAEIDVRPPQVIIQVLIAEVSLNDNEELGVELGTQSSVLFDRSIVVNNQLSPGFNFNTTNPLTSNPLAPASEIGLQSLSNFALGRGNPALGFGGLILAASSDNLSILLRALQLQQRLDVLSRPQIMTSDSREAQIQIGQNVPLISGSTVTQLGNIINQIERTDVGIILRVIPRISPDGVVVMDVIPEVSGLADTGVPIGTDSTGATITAPVVNITQAQTTIAAADGQTVVIGGLIVKENSITDRKVPFLGDIPVVGWGFRYRQINAIKRELLIILTPHIIYNEMDAQYIKDMEARRIDWILKNVEAIHGDIGLTPPPVALPSYRTKGRECIVIDPGKPPELMIHDPDLGPDEFIDPDSIRFSPETEADGEMDAPYPATPPYTDGPKMELTPTPIGQVDRNAPVKKPTVQPQVVQPASFEPKPAKSPEAKQTDFIPAEYTDESEQANQSEVRMEPLPLPNAPSPSPKQAQKSWWQKSVKSRRNSQ